MRSKEAGTAKYRVVLPLVERGSDVKGKKRDLEHSDSYPIYFFCFRERRQRERERNQGREKEERERH